MNHYIELTIVPNEEIPIYDIWPRLFTQVHLALVEIKDSNNQVPIGVSFPQYKIEKVGGKNMYCLGSKVRLFANSAEELQKLNLDKWLEKLTDYIHIKTAKPVKNVDFYLTVGRYRPQANAEKLARRYARRHHISYDDALKRLEGFKQRLEDYPYIQLKSLSGNREFSLCIKQSTVKEPHNGLFSTYGLSATSTVPHWSS